MDAVLAVQRYMFGLVYLDDIIIHSAIIKEHADQLNSVLEYLELVNLKVKWSNCEFAKSELQALGHGVKEGKIDPAPENSKAVIEYPNT